MTTHRPTPEPPTRRRLGLSVLAVACLLGIVTACTSPTPESALPGATGATAPVPSDPSASASALDPEEAMLQWARCMRDNGIDVPDPDHGQVTVDGKGVSPEQLQAAEEACEQWQRMAEPEDGGTPLTAEEKQSFLDHAQCMRDRGWNVSDPTFEGGRVEQQFRRGATTAPGDPAPGDPRFEKDLAECAEVAGLDLPDEQKEGE
jgi:hypothetical protein